MWSQLFPFAIKLSTTKEPNAAGRLCVTDGREQAEAVRQQRRALPGGSADIEENAHSYRLSRLGEDHAFGCESVYELYATQLQRPVAEDAGQLFDGFRL